MKLPESWKIHDIISIAQLEPGPKENNPFSRTQSNETEPVANKDSDFPLYEVERLIDCWIRQFRKGKSKIQYCVKWKGWGPEWNSWLSEEDLQDTKELMTEYINDNGLSSPSTNNLQEP